MRNALRFLLPLLLALLGSPLALLAQDATTPPPPAIRTHATGALGGPLTLYLPGFATPGGAYEDLARAVDPARRSVFVTYAGFGGVPAVDTPWYPAVREALFAFVAADPSRAIDVVGHSMGGTLALELAARFPARVEHVVLLDALACMRCVMMPGVPAEALAYDTPQARAMLAMTPAEAHVANAQMARGMTADTARQRELTGYLDAADRATYVRGYIDLLRLDLRPRLADIPAAITVLGAPSFGAEQVRATLTEQFAGAADLRLRIAPAGTQHYLMWDAPAWTATEVREALTAQP